MPLQSRECVILLHGLARTSDSMVNLETELSKIQYYVANINYPSRKHSIKELADIAVKAGLDECTKHEASPVNFVTHSLGGILVRQYFSKHTPDIVKRVVMLGPPNKGSEVVDNLKNMPGFELFNGPAGMQLGTDANSAHVNLGPVNFDLGIIAGTKSVNLILFIYLFT
jgi:triacylglycerol esterase/lipase EstA (alpha/beta hydrolase family)